MVEGEENEESYASAFADFVFNDDVDDCEIEKEKKDEEIEKENKDEEIEKEKEDVEIVKVKDIADDGTGISKELTATISPTTATTSKDSITTKRKKISSSHKTKTLLVNKDREVDSINAQEMITKEFATHGPKMIEKLFQKNMQNKTLNLYPTTSMSIAGKSFADLQHQLYLNMKSKPQDQAVDPEI
ncbi:hypothetical protein Tco_1413131 [Tanacetum coccineum]